MNRRSWWLLWLMPLSLMAQTNAELKLQHLYNSHKYARCLKKSSHLIDSKHYQDSAFPYLFKALSLQHQLLNKSGKLELENIRQSYFSALTGLSKKNGADVFSHENIYYDSLLHYYHHLGHNLMLSGHKTEAKALVHKLAKEFSDTLDYYQVFYPTNNSELYAREYFSTPSNPHQTLGDSLATMACTFQHKAYRYGGKDTKGFDDSGFLQYVFMHFGIALPTSLTEISELGSPVSFSELTSGDLIFFGKTRPHHAAMIVLDELGNRRIVHCTARGIVVEMFHGNTHWAKHPIYSMKRFGQGPNLSVQIPR